MGKAIDCLLQEIWAKMLVKVEDKTLLVNTARNFLIMLNNMPQMHLKLFQKERFKRQQKQLVVSLEIKFLIKLQESQNLHQRIIQIKKNQMKEKYVEKGIYISRT